jgi:L-lysine exporter family protein LysE/ArgO
MWIAATVAGLLAGAGLIIAIGAQNAFVLRQGLQRRHVGTVVLACAGADIALILAGVGGMGALVMQWPLLLACLAFTLLNPHVYLDTVVLLGSLSTRYPGQLRWAFAAGACVASVAWFCTLGYGARLLQPMFRNPTAWRVLDAGVAVFMFCLATLLLLRPL